MATRAEIDRHCKKCRWHGLISNRICCDYLLWNRVPRGCKADLDCDKFEKKESNYKSQITISPRRLAEQRKAKKENDKQERDK